MSLASDVRYQLTDGGLLGHVAHNKEGNAMSIRPNDDFFTDLTPVEIPQTHREALHSALTDDDPYESEDNCDEFLATLFGPSEDDDIANELEAALEDIDAE